MEYHGVRLLTGGSQRTGVQSDIVTNNIYMPLVKSLHLSRPTDYKIPSFTYKMKAMLSFPSMRTEKGNCQCVAICPPKMQFLINTWMTASQ